LNNVKIDWYTGVQGFAAGAIVMACICNYNRSQMPIAIVAWFMSIIFRLGDE